MVLPSVSIRCLGKRFTLAILVQNKDEVSGQEERDSHWFLGPREVESQGHVQHGSTHWQLEKRQRSSRGRRVLLEAICCLSDHSIKWHARTGSESSPRNIPLVTPGLLTAGAAVALSLKPHDILRGDNN